MTANLQHVSSPNLICRRSVTINSSCGFRSDSRQKLLVHENLIVSSHSIFLSVDVFKWSLTVTNYEGIFTS